MDERIFKILSEMDPYMPSGTMMGFLHRYSGNIMFNVTFSKAEAAEDISALDLSVRGEHCLRRSGIKTVLDLIELVRARDGEDRSKTKLLRLRNLGRKTAEEILLMLMYYQFKILPDKKRYAFVREVVELNERRRVSA